MIAITLRARKIDFLTHRITMMDPSYMTVRIQCVVASDLKT